jgi:hypothetical protein
MKKKPYLLSCAGLRTAPRRPFEPGRSLRLAPSPIKLDQPAFRVFLLLRQALAKQGFGAVVLPVAGLLLLLVRKILARRGSPSANLPCDRSARAQSPARDHGVCIIRSRSMPAARQRLRREFFRQSEFTLALVQGTQVRQGHEGLGMLGT